MVLGYPGLSKGDSAIVGRDATRFQQEEAGIRQSVAQAAPENLILQAAAASNHGGLRRRRGSQPV